MRLLTKPSLDTIIINETLEQNCHPCVVHSLEIYVSQSHNPYVAIVLFTLPFYFPVFSLHLVVAFYHCPPISAHICEIGFNLLTLSDSPNLVYSETCDERPTSNKRSQ